MPEILLYGTQLGDPLRVTVKDRFHELPIHRDGAVLTILDSTTEFIDGRKGPYIRVEGSQDMTSQDIVEIANHFSTIIDVSLRDGEGWMYFNEKGQERNPDEPDLLVGE